MMTDPIADLLTRIRNGQQARHATVVVPASRIKRRIAEILAEEGYVLAVGDATLNNHPAFEVELKYVDGAGVIQKLTRESRPGRRIYVDVDEIPEVRNGLGLSIVSTSRGVMTGREAKEKNVGGEVIATFY